jgi:hypothetical protein
VSERVKYLLTVFHRSARAIIRLEMYVIVQSAMKYVVMHSFLYSMFYRILTTVPCTYVSCNKFYAIDASGSTKKTKIAHPLCVFFALFDKKYLGHKNYCVGVLGVSTLIKLQVRHSKQSNN